MLITKTKINNSYIIKIEKVKDNRGFFATTWDATKFVKYDLNPKMIECNVSFNKLKGTLRGLHYQMAPYEGAKLIRCTRGKIFDVILDLRPKSSTFMKWRGTILSSDNYKMNYVPDGCAHGFQTLDDNTEVFYQMSQVYMPKYSNGIRWDDPVFKISWPLKPTVISKKDLTWDFFGIKNPVNKKHS
ncbi:MAG TPA: dTDP-4-dehydrorhamnose 3,5-epimerase [Candidatus Acidoferrales bacterium]|nr:dTDP-4-dehydrorhamnose 3,5-epimerase [Candidatus Acidoferrales bacterium]